MFDEYQALQQSHHETSQPIILKIPLNRLNVRKKSTITPAVMGCHSTYTHTCVPPTALYLGRGLPSFTVKWNRKKLSSKCLTFCIQHLRDVQVLLSDIKGGVQISHWVILSESKHQNMGHCLLYCWSLNMVGGSRNASPCAVYRNQ